MKRNRTHRIGLQIDTTDSTGFNRHALQVPPTAVHVTGHSAALDDRARANTPWEGEDLPYCESTNPGGVGEVFIAARADRTLHSVILCGQPATAIDGSGTPLCLDCAARSQEVAQ